MNSLRNFCDRYLNVAREVCEFRPFLPYVFLVVLDYGRMAIEELNPGWVSQNEVFFGVPLAMWRPDRLGRPVFQKWVLNTPFIVVDDARSLTGGRESYAWPKVLGTLRSSPERWLIDPRSPKRPRNFCGVEGRCSRCKWTSSRPSAPACPPSGRR